MLQWTGREAAEVSYRSLRLFFFYFTFVHCLWGLTSVSAKLAVVQIVLFLCGSVIWLSCCNRFQHS